MSDLVRRDSARLRRPRAMHRNLWVLVAVGLVVVILLGKLLASWTVAGAALAIMVLVPMYGVLVSSELLVALLVTTLIVPFNVMTFGGYSIEAAYLVYPLLIGKAAYLYIAERSTATRVPGMLGMLGLVVFTISSIYLSYRVSDQAAYGPPQVVRHTLPLAVVLIAGFVLKRPISPRSAIRFIVSATAIYLFYELVLREILPAGPADFHYRISAAGAEFGRVGTSQLGPNSFSVFLVLPLISIQAEIVRRRAVTVWLIAAAAIVGYAYIHTFSRNGFLALIVAELVYFLLSDHARRRVLASAVTALAAGVGYVVVRGDADVIVAAFTRAGRFAQVGQYVTASGYQALSLSLGERLFFWKSGLDVFGTHPLTGVGYGPSGVNIAIDPAYVGAKSIIALSHNTFISMLAIGGIVGFTLLLMFAAPIVVRGWNLARRLPPSSDAEHGAETSALLGIYSWLAASVVACSFDDLLYFNRPFTLLWGLAAIVFFRAASAETDHTKVFRVEPREPRDVLSVRPSNRYSTQ